MKVLFKEGNFENLIVVPDNVHYSITVISSENEEKQLVFTVGGEHFVLVSTTSLYQNTRGTNLELATDMFNEIVFHLSRQPIPVDVWDISSIQSRILAKYEEAWRELEALLEPKKEVSTLEETRNKYMKAPYIFSKILTYLESKQGSTVGEWFRDAEVKMNEEGNLLISVQSAFSMEVIKRRSLPLMKEAVKSLGLDMDVIITTSEEEEAF